MAAHTSSFVRICQALVGSRVLLITTAMEHAEVVGTLCNVYPDALHVTQCEGKRHLYIRLAAVVSLQAAGDNASSAIKLNAIKLSLSQPTGVAMNGRSPSASKQVATGRPMRRPNASAPTRRRA